MRSSVVRQVLAGALCVAGAACVFPDDRSAELQVELAPVPTLFLRDSLDLEARLVDGNGDPVPNAVIRYATSDPLVAAVSAAGRLVAVGVGAATLTATAVEFAAATPVAQTIQVRGLIEVDSIRPVDVLFGQLATVYGVGLNPDSLFAVTVGGVQARVAGFVPDDPAAPDRFGRLTLWVPPPAARRSQVAVLGFKGGVVHSESLQVIQRDVFEPNDTLAADLGPIPLGFRNPALAFEVRGRDDDRQPADWYRFSNDQVRDRTIFVASQTVGAETFRVFVTDSLGWDGAVGEFRIGSASWTIGPQAYFCGGRTMTLNGEPFQPFEQPFPFTLLALRDLPVGEYDVIVPYVPSGEPPAYELAIASAYVSVLSPDPAEENDYCDVAKDLFDPALDLAGGTTLTIDNFHDVDWFAFETTDLLTQVDVVATAENPDADLDLYLIGDFRPDSLPVLAVGAGPGTEESLSAVVAQGKYLLLVVDFPGVPTAYTLTPKQALAGPAAVTAAPARVEAPAAKTTMDAATDTVRWRDRLRRVP